MKRFSISDIEILTGIKAHTIRIWEQRYNFFTSKRSDSNIRYYDNEDLRLFLNISTLNQNGYKISKISKMTLSEINTIVDDLKKDHLNSNTQVQMLANATIRLDTKEFEEVLAGCVEDMGLQEAMKEVFSPFLNKIKFMWQVGIITTANERFAEYLLCNKIITLTNNLPEFTSNQSKKFLLYLPFGEIHEISLLFIKYLLKENGHKILYLGAHLPLNDLIEAISVYEPEYAVTVFTQKRTVLEINNMVSRILESSSDLSLIVSGNKIARNSFKSHPRLLVIQNTEEFIELFNSGIVSLAS